jgi:thiol-disulfide isomerase/thioredoxin
MRKISILVTVLICHFIANAQSIEDFSLPNVVDESNFSLSSLKGEKAVAIIFFSGKCAYSEYYLERILALHQKFAPLGVKFLLINSNKSDYVEQESFEGMKSFVAINNILFPYLADKEKNVKNVLHATRTPEVFVLQRSENLFNVVYKGAIDDNPQSASDVSHAYLQETLINLLNNNKIEVNQTRPVGCLIK